MDPLEQEILQRFDDSRNAYNKATSLLKSGKSDEAEALLRRALTLYPREIFLNEDIEIDKSVLDSYDLLFSNIRERLEKIEREKEMPPRLDDGAIKSLQDLIERNQGSTAPSRRPGMKTQASGMVSSSLPVSPQGAHIDTQTPALDLDTAHNELSHEQIVHELETAARNAHAFKAPDEAGAQVLEEGEVDAFEINLDGDETQPPVPVAPEPDTFDFDDIPAEPAGADLMDDALVDEIVLQEDSPENPDSGISDSDEPTLEPAPDIDEAPASGDADDEAPVADQDAAPQIADSGATPEHSAEELEMILGEINQAAGDAEAGSESPEESETPDSAAPDPVDEPQAGATAFSEQDEPADEPDIAEPADEPESDTDSQPNEFDDLTPIHKDKNAAPAEPVVQKTQMPANKPVQEAAQFEDVSLISVPSLPAPPTGDDGESAHEAGAMHAESAFEDVDADIPKPGRGLMGFIDKIKNLLPIKRKKSEDEFDQMLAGVDTQADQADADPAPEPAQEPAAEQAPAVQAAAPEPAAAESAPAPEPPQPQAAAPGQEQPGEEEALEDEAVVAEMVKIEEPRERKVHIQVYDGGRTARLLSSVLVLALFGVGLLAAYLVAKPSVQLHYAYRAAMESGEAGEAPSWAGRVMGLAWGVVPAAGDGDQRLVSAVELASRDELKISKGQNFRIALAAAGISNLQESGSFVAAARFGRWARSNHAAGRALNQIEFQSLSAAASQAMRDGKHKEALSHADAMISRLEAPEYPGPGLHDQAVREAARVRFLALAHAAGAALNAGHAEKAFKLIEPLLKSEAGLDSGLAKAFAGLKQKIKDALNERAASVRQAQGEEAAQPIADMADRL